MQIEIVPVAHGDCLLIGGTKQAPFPRMLVDGGPTGLWRDRLRPALRRHVAPDELVVVDVVVVTHVDDDHIGGILELFREMKRDRDAGVAARFQINDLWHNAPGPSHQASAPPPGAFDEPFEVEAASNSAGRMEEANHETMADATSFSQSDALVTLATELEIPLNAAFGGAKITEGVTPSSAEMKGRIRVLGPDANAFARLDQACRRGSGGDGAATA